MCNKIVGPNSLLKLLSMFEKIRIFSNTETICSLLKTIKDNLQEWAKKEINKPVIHWQMGQDCTK